MFKNYFIIAVRQLWKNKGYTLLNLAGLVAGISCFMLISVYILHELSYDRYHEKKDRIYRLVLGGIKQGVPHGAVSGGVMPHVLQAEYAGIEKVVRFRKLPSLVSAGEKSFFEEKFFFTDSTVFDIFSFRVLEGDARSSLTEPFSIVLTEKSATTYFGRSSGVVGELLRVDNEMTFEVTAVVENIPDYSHFKFDFLASASTLPLHPQEPVRTYQLTGWFAHYFYNYILLSENADPVQVSKKILDAAKYHADPEHYQLYGTNLGLYLQPLTDIHLNPLYGELERQSDGELLVTLAGVALLILVLACINFANINTSLSLGRRKEVGCRMSLGAGKAQLVMQFLGESTLICLVAFSIGVACVEMLLPWFNSFTGKQIHWVELFNARTLAILLIALILTALAGGLYPALIATRYSSADILRGIAPMARTSRLRKAIIVFQFSISIVLISFSLVVYKQIQHMLNKDLGLNTEQVIVLPVHGNPQVLSRLPVFFDELQRKPSVVSSSVCELVPGETIFTIMAKFEGFDNIGFPTIAVGFNYLETFKMQLLAGRDFSREQVQDTLTDRVLINETLSKRLGWTPAEAIGKSYDRGGDGERPGEVIGVIRDFNFTSAKTETPPIVLAYSPNFFDKVAVRLQGNAGTSIEEVRNAWENVYPGRPFAFRFADEVLQKQYDAEQRFGKLFSYFSVLAVLIGFLGLFGTLSLSLNLRTREIVIRKVLGASLNSLVSKLSGDFVVLVAIAFFIGLPLSIWLAEQWLNDFAYRITSVIWLVILPGAGLILLALVLVGIQTTRSANANPVDYLRNE